MNPLLIKSLIAAGGIGLGGVGIWQINEHMKPRTIQERLEGEGVTFPATEGEADIETWKTLFDNNKNATSNKVNDLDDGVADTEKGKKMRDRCKELMAKLLSGASDGEINQVRGRCAKPSAQSVSQT